MADGISISEEAPHYFEYEGEPTLLLGGSVEDNLFQIDNLENHLDALVDVGGNYVRCTMSCRDDGDVWPFEERADGRYDLENWNPKFWQRFERFLELTAERDIVPQIELWATFDYYSTWDKNPFNPINNVNYSSNASGLPVAVDDLGPPLNQNTFFWSVPGLANLETVLAHQHRFVDELLSRSFEYDHVLYCIDNETHAPIEWITYWAGYVRKCARKQNHHIETTGMVWQKDLRHPRHRAIHSRPELFTFWDISQNNLNHGAGVWTVDQEGETHWDRIKAARERLGPARPLTNVKIYGSTSDGRQRFWRDVFGGCASVRFHRPPHGQGLSAAAKADIRAARDIMNQLTLRDIQPASSLLTDRRDNEAYLIAGGDSAAIYFPDGGTATVEANYSECRWYDIDRSDWASIESIGSAGRINSPDTGHQVAVLK